MSRLSNILRGLDDGKVAFRCPGCNDPHVINISGGPNPSWNYNGNPEKPTFTPSVLVRTINGGAMTEADWDEYDRIAKEPGGTEAVLNHPKFKWVCHSFVTDGRIQFLSDCTHILAGQTVDLPEFPHSKWEPTP